uniref:Uncharacterized protein n=1 Tax=Rhizophora mucronata TaxID=61149 RepID=A0A2P2NSU5_RHIMU
MSQIPKYICLQCLTELWISCLAEVSGCYFQRTKFKSCLHLGWKVL